jgi:hypothetical protein
MGRERIVKSHSGQPDSKLSLDLLNAMNTTKHCNAKVKHQDWNVLYKVFEYNTDYTVLISYFLAAII